eukprot:7458008-Pyramimonas_sp.AAC.1
MSGGGRIGPGRIGGKEGRNDIKEQAALRNEESVIPEVPVAGARPSRRNACSLLRVVAKKPS